MLNRNHAVKYILSFFLALAAFLAVNQHGAVANAAGSDRLYYFNMDDNGLEGSMILVESDGHWGLIDAGHRKAEFMRDYTSGSILYASPENGLSSQVYCRNGKDVANYMVNQLGVTHLDFIVGTHAHADHIGGIPELAATSFKDSSGRTRYLVDSNTTYYYKEYQHISDLEDDLVNYSSNSWHNQAFASQAEVAMQNRGANLVDVSKAQVIHGDAGNTYGDYITFTVGNMSFRLYNVHEQTNTGDENVNSIVTVMTNGNYTIVNLSDINTNNGAIDKTSRAIAKDYGDVDIVVAGHHGLPGSNTKTMFDSLQPSFVIVPNGQETSWLYTDCDLAAAIPYAQGMFGTLFYNLSISQYAVVTDLSGHQVYVYSVSGKGDLTNAVNKMMKSANKTGWVSWVQTNGTLWSYLEGGKSAKNGWKQIDGKMYYFDKTGIMQTGWVNQGGNNIRYADPDGSMATGWRYISGKWYYFETDYGRLLKKAGWQQIDGKMYYFDSSGAMQTGWVNQGGNNIRYADPDGSMATGWRLIDGRWYYFETDYGRLLKKAGWQQIDGKMYYFDSSGAMQTGWVNQGGNNIRYADPDGSMATGWRRIDGKLYYFETDYGRLQKQSGWQQIGGTMYFFDENGAIQTGWINQGGKDIRYADPDTSAMATGWRLIDGKWYYFETDYGRLLKKAGWQQIDGKMYYFDSSGAMQTGWVNQGGNNIRYADPDGSMATGWRRIDGKLYYFETDYGRLQKQSGWQQVDGTMYFFDENGAIQTGWINQGGKDIRYADPDTSAMATGWRLIDGKWYYFETDYGRMLTGWQQIDGKMYYLNDDGSMHTGWITQGEKTRYLEPGSGHMLVGWQQIDGKWYYFETDYGVMLRNTTTPDGYYVNADGVWVQ